MGLSPEFLDELRRAIMEDWRWRWGDDVVPLREWWARAYAEKLPTPDSPKEPAPK